MANQNPKKPGPAGGKGSSSREDGVFKAPVIVRDPSSRQVRAGGRVALRVVATGTPRPSYQWFHNGSKVAGATSDVLTLANVRALNGGHYHCEAHNFAGRAASSVATVTIVSQSLPALVVEPAGLSVPAGQPIALRVVSAPPEILRQFRLIWTFNGKRIRGAQGHELLIGGAKAKYQGTYKAMATTAEGLMVSNAVSVEVLDAGSPAPDPARVEPAQPERATPAEEPFFFNPDAEPAAAGGTQAEENQEDLPLAPAAEMPAEHQESSSVSLAVELPLQPAEDPALDLSASLSPAAEPASPEDAPADAAIDLSVGFAEDLSLGALAGSPPPAGELEPGPLPLPGEDPPAPEPVQEAPSRKMTLLSRLQDAFKRRNEEKARSDKPGNVA